MLVTVVSRHRHSATRLSTYLNVHQNRLEQLLRGGFLISADDLQIEAGDGCILIEGLLHCQGGIIVDVSKRIVFLEDEEDPLVQTVDYSYCVTLRNVGVICRYDSPHKDHQQDHHVHRYDVLDGDRDGKVEPIYEEDERPLLAEVVEEAAEWFFKNLARLQRDGLVSPGFPDS